MLRIPRIPWIQIAILVLTISAAGCQRTPTKTSSEDSVGAQRVNTAAQLKITAVQGSSYEAPEGDTDGDGLRDEVEVELGTDPFWPDSDNDRLPDGYEIATGQDPLVANSAHLAELRDRIAKADVAPGCETFDTLLHNPACTMIGFNATTCTATCTGTCLFGAVSCFWSWGAVQWAADKLAGAPCPGWTCHCP